jgi:hypothetical protein
LNQSHGGLQSWFQYLLLSSPLQSLRSSWWSVNREESYSLKKLNANRTIETSSDLFNFSEHAFRKFINHIINNHSTGLLVVFPDALTSLFFSSSAYFIVSSFNLFIASYSSTERILRNFFSFLLSSTRCYIQSYIAGFSFIQVNLRRSWVIQSLKFLISWVQSLEPSHSVT